MEKLIVISWCSWVGKNTVWEYLEPKMNDIVSKVVTCTTRPKRQWETDWKEYYFMSEKKFNDDVKNGEIFEWTITHNIFYWSSVKWLETAVKSNKIPLYIIDVKWLDNMKSILKGKYEILSIFITPPSFEILEQRIRLRGSETEKSIETRLNTAKEELKHLDSYRFEVKNYDYESCWDQIEKIIRDWASGL